MSAEDAARRAWLAKQDQPNPSIRRHTSDPSLAYGTPVPPAYSAPAAPVTSEAVARTVLKQDVPSWGHEVAALAEARQHGQTRRPPLQCPAAAPVASCGLLRAHLKALGGSTRA